MILHWLIALMIAFNFVAVWISEDWPRPDRMQIMGAHKAVGISILFLTLVRLAWRFTHRPPPLQRNLKLWERALARFTHTAFYVLMIAIPLAGWAMSSSYGPVRMFGLFSVPPLPVSTSKAAGDTFYGIHTNLAWLMLGLMALHVAGAIKHQFFDRDRTLGRMIPFVMPPRV